MYKDTHIIINILYKSVCMVYINMYVSCVLYNSSVYIIQIARLMAITEVLKEYVSWYWSAVLHDIPKYTGNKVVSR